MRLGLLDIGAVAAIGVFVVGAFLPLCITEYPVMTITADLLDSTMGLVAVLIALAAVVFTVRHFRIVALVALVAAGSIAVWRTIDLTSLEGSTLQSGAYVMAAGLVGGVALLVIDVVRHRLSLRDVEEWDLLTAREDTPVPVSLSEIASEDPALVVE